MARKPPLTPTRVSITLASGRTTTGIRHKNLLPTIAGPVAGPATIQADSTSAALGVRPTQEQLYEAPRVPDNHISNADRLADFEAYRNESDAAYAAAYYEKREDEDDEVLSDSEQTAKYNSRILELDNELKGMAESLTTAEMVVTSDYDFNVSAHVLEFTDVRTGMQVRQFFGLDDYISSTYGLAELAALVAELDA